MLAFGSFTNKLESASFTSACVYFLVVGLVVTLVVGEVKVAIPVFVIGAVVATVVTVVVSTVGVPVATVGLLVTVGVVVATVGVTVAKVGVVVATVLTVQYELYDSTTNSQNINRSSIQFSDSPGTTSAVTYQYAFAPTGGAGGNARINQYGGATSMVVMEVSP